MRKKIDGVGLTAERFEGFFGILKKIEKRQRVSWWKLWIRGRNFRVVGLGVSPVVEG